MIVDIAGVLLLTGLAFSGIWAVLAVGLLLTMAVLLVSFSRACDGVGDKVTTASLGVLGSLYALALGFVGLFYISAWNLPLVGVCAWIAVAQWIAGGFIILASIDRPPTTRDY